MFFVATGVAFKKLFSSLNRSMDSISDNHQRPTRAGKDRTMFKSFSPSGRQVAALFGAIVLASLAACGGGGGSSEVPTKTPASADLSGSKGCTSPEGGTGCNILAAWQISNAVDPKVTVGSSTVGTTATGTSNAQMAAVGDVTVTAYDGTKQLASVVVKAECPATAPWNGNMCATTVAHYSELKLAVYANRGAYMGVVKATGEVPLVNNTGYTTGAAFPVGACGIYMDWKLPNGWPMSSCETAATGGTRRNFPIDPINGSLEKEYTGVVPAGAVLRDVFYPPNIPYAKHGVGYTGSFLDTKEGIYYFLASDTYHLRLTSDNFVTNTVVGTGDYKYMTMFSN